MNVDVTGAEPAEVDADVLAVPVGGALVQELDSLFAVGWPARRPTRIP